jgi:hypothetical protein
MAAGFYSLAAAGVELTLCLHQIYISDAPGQGDFFFRKRGLIIPDPLLLFLPFQGKVHLPPPV